MTADHQAFIERVACGAYTFADLEELKSFMRKELRPVLEAGEAMHNKMANDYDQQPNEAAAWDAAMKGKP
jgi:hypothetical protein